MKIIFLISICMFTTSCTLYKLATTTVDIVEHYPSDNPIEEYGEGLLEEYLGAEEGSIDISIFTPEE